MTPSYEFYGVLTGIKPSGRLHLGNYFGALKPLIDYPSPYFKKHVLVADWHCLNYMTREEARNNTDIMIDDLMRLSENKFEVRIGNGEDHSYNYFMNFVSLGELLRNHAAKVLRDSKDSINMGLLTYPVMMASDCLGYDVVIVGKDQAQHMEIVNNILRRADKPEVRVILTDAQLLGTDGRKMSKSYNNTIPLFGEGIPEAYMKIKTDSKDVNEPKEESSLLVQYGKVLGLNTEPYLNGGVSNKEMKERLVEAHFKLFPKE